MDSAYPLSEKFDLNLDCLQIERIALFSNRKSAQAFIDEVFPVYCNCYLLSAEGDFPEQRLREKILSELATNSNMRVIVFNALALKKIKIKSEKILILDDLLMQDLRSHRLDRELGLGLTPLKLGHLMESFYSQWDKLHRLNNPEFAFKHFKEFRQHSFDWRAALVGEDLVPEGNS